MLSFLTMEEETKLYKFVRITLTEKFNQRIDIEEADIVKGNLYGEKIVEGFKIRFFPEEATWENIDVCIQNDIEKYCRDNGLNLAKELILERDVWLGKIRYGLVYTYLGEPVNCEDCWKLCKHEEPIICEYYAPKERV